MTSLVYEGVAFQISTSLPEDVLNGSSDEGALVLRAPGKEPIEISLRDSSSKPQRSDELALFLSSTLVVVLEGSSALCIQSSYAFTSIRLVVNCSLYQEMQSMGMARPRSR